MKKLFINKIKIKMFQEEISMGEKNLRNDIIKNKKLVEILNHKMFKGYRDIKAAKDFFSKYERKTKLEDFEPFDDLYNLCYRKNFLSSIRSSNFNNMINIQHFPKNKLYKYQKNISRPKSSRSYISNNKSISTVDGKKNLNPKDNFL